MSTKEEEAKQSKLLAELQVQTFRIKTCRKCRAHGTVVELEGHKYNCSYRICDCMKCQKLDHQRDGKKERKCQTHTKASKNSKRIKDKQESVTIHHSPSSCSPLPQPCRLLPVQTLLASALPSTPTSPGSVEDISSNSEEEQNICYPQTPPPPPQMSNYRIFETQLANQYPQPILTAISQGSAEDISISKEEQNTCYPQTPPSPSQMANYRTFATQCANQYPQPVSTAISQGSAEDISINSKEEQNICYPQTPPQLASYRTFETQLANQYQQPISTAISTGSAEDISISKGEQNICYPQTPRPPSLMANYRTFATQLANQYAQFMSNGYSPYYQVNTDPFTRPASGGINSSDVSQSVPSQPAYQPIQINYNNSHPYIARENMQPPFGFGFWHPNQLLRPPVMSVRNQEQGFGAFHPLQRYLYNSGNAGYHGDNHDETSVVPFTSGCHGDQQY